MIQRHTLPVKNQSVPDEAPKKGMSLTPTMCPNSLTRVFSNFFVARDLSGIKAPQASLRINIHSYMPN